jgi:hypothetical protein
VNTIRAHRSLSLFPSQEHVSFSWRLILLGALTPAILFALALSLPLGSVSWHLGKGVMLIYGPPLACVGLRPDFRRSQPALLALAALLIYGGRLVAESTDFDDIKVEHSSLAGTFGILIESCRRELICSRAMQHSCALFWPSAIRRSSPSRRSTCWASCGSTVRIRTSFRWEALPRRRRPRSAQSFYGLLPCSARFRSSYDPLRLVPYFLALIRPYLLCFSSTGCRLRAGLVL